MCVIKILYLFGGDYNEIKNSTLVAVLSTVVSATASAAPQDVSFCMHWSL